MAATRFHATRRGAKRSLREPSRDGAGRNRSPYSAERAQRTRSDGLPSRPPVAAALDRRDALAARANVELTRMAFDLSSRRAHLVVATIAVVALSAVNNGPLFWRGEAPGDLIDGRFNLYVLEHIYRWLTGQDASLVSPAIFYPFRDVLFFSDAHAGSALVYAAFRALGQSPFIAYDSWFLIGYVSTFVAAYYAIARFGGDALTAALGAAIFAFSLPSVAQFGHSQLVYRCGAPMALLQLWLGVRDGSARSFVLAFIWLCFQFLLSIYLGMFLFLVMAAFAVAAPVVERDAKPPRAWLGAFVAASRRMLRSPRPFADGFAVSVVVAVVIAAATLALFAGYAHTAHEYKFHRGWSEIATMLPRPVSYLLMADLPYWRSVSSTLSAAVPMPWEHNLFIGFGVLGFFVVGVLAVARNSSAALGAAPARAMAISLFVVALLTLNFGHGFALYRPLAALPGFGAIRAVSRIGLVLAFPAAVVAAVGLRSLIAESRPKVVGALIAAGLACLAGFEFATIARYTMPIADAERRVDALVAAARQQAQGAASPILLALGPSAADGTAQAVELDAMLAAQRLGWPTINGYSGNFPPGVTAYVSCASAARQFGEYEWQRHDARDRLGDADAALKRIVFVGEDCDSDPLNRVLAPAPTHAEPTSADLPAQVAILPLAMRRDGSVVRFSVKIQNNSADKWIPGRSANPVSLSWRFAPVNQNSDDNQAWNPRKPLATDVAPGGTLVMSTTAAVPQASGDYRLEVSLVADGLFWFHNKGMKPLRFEPIITVSQAQ